MSSNLYNFESKGRIPVVPLSYEFKDIAKIREFIVDYSAGDAYVKTDDGELINICASKSTMEKFAQYLKDNPDIVASIVVKTPDGEEESMEATFAKFYEILDKINNKSFLYAGSSTDGGAATSANKLNNALTISEDGKTTTYDGSSTATVDLTKYYKTTGGEITGEVILKDALICSSGYTYGTTLPSSGTEGQLFFLIVD